MSNEDEHVDVDGYSDGEVSSVRVRKKTLVMQGLSQTN